MYKVIKRAISKELAEFCYEYLCNKKKVARLLYDTRYISQFNMDWGRWNDQQVTNTFSCYSDLVMETLLQKLKYRVELETELKLNETYSYTRLYKKGDVLPRHKDRYSCEVSTTMNIGGDPWPIFIEPDTEKGRRNNKNIYEAGGTKGKKVILEAGDMLVYKGHNCEHWREPFEGQDCVQVFLHYNAERSGAEVNMYDTRPHLGLPRYFRGIKIDK